VVAVAGDKAPVLVGDGDRQDHDPSATTGQVPWRPPMVPSAVPEGLLAIATQDVVRRSAD